MDDEDDNFFEQFFDGNASDILLDFDEENSDVEEIEFEDDDILDIDNLAYTFYEETPETLESNSPRSGRGFPVKFDKLKENGVGVDVPLLTQEILGKPKKLFMLIRRQKNIPQAPKKSQKIRKTCYFCKRNGISSRCFDSCM